jgi:hypothetical protein
MVPFWPDVAKNHSMTKAANEFADTFDSINKIVFSQSLGSAEGKNTRIVRTKLQDEMLKLKQQQGKNILTGGVAIPSQLIELGLVDEYHFVVHPIVAFKTSRVKSSQIRRCCASLLETLTEKHSRNSRCSAGESRFPLVLPAFR